MDKLPARYVFLPYCVKQVKDGRYIVLNRDYKPLGNPTKDWVEYESQPSCLAMKITPAKARAMSWKESEDTGFIFLYSDACIPTESAVHWNAYSKRLKVLASLTVEVP